MTNHPNRNWRAQLAAEVEHLGSDLLAAWSRCGRARGLTLKEQCAVMSRDTGHNYTPNLVGRWRRGERPIPAPAARHMRAYVLGALGLWMLAPIMEPPTT